MSCDPLTLEIPPLKPMPAFTAQLSASVRKSIRLVTREAPAALVALDLAQTVRIATALRNAGTIFIAGAGRTGLVLRMFSMRLMHLGYTVHLVGDVTTPAIQPGDVLLVASGSGTTRGTVAAASAAAEAGATVLAVTSIQGSLLARRADLHVILPTPQKTDHGSGLSEQFSGSMFEQMLFLLSESIFHALWNQSAKSAVELYSRHANLE